MQCPITDLRYSLTNIRICLSHSKLYSCKTCRVQRSLCITSYLRSHSREFMSQNNTQASELWIWLFTAENEPGKSFPQLFPLSEVLRENFHVPGQTFIFHPSIFIQSIRVIIYGKWPCLCQLPDNHVLTFN